MEQDDKILEIKDIKTINDIQTVIEQRAGVGLRDSIAVGKKFGWFGGQTFELFESVPISQDPLTIFAMFQNPDEVHVYAIAVPKNGAQPKDVALYQRFTLSKHAAGLVYSEVFPGTKDDPLLGLEAFIDAIVADLQKLSVDPDEGLEAIETLERAREALEAEDLDAVMKILKGEEDEDPPPNGKTAPAPPPPAA